jgi:hypothetical protein
MTLSNETMNSWRRAVRQLTLVVFSAAACAVVAHAQTPPYALFQYSTLTGSGNTFTATWVPVVTASGTVYKNITFLFDVSSTGVLTIAPGYPEIVPSPTPLISSFQAGKYVGPSTIYNGEMIINVSGPGIAPGGATEWSLAAATGAYYYTYPATGTWYVGPIASNPLAARLKAAGITSTAWSYGVSTSEYGSPWATNTLIGVSQTSNAITFVSFTDTHGDHNEYVDTITYTLVQ